MEGSEWESGYVAKTEVEARRHRVKGGG
jgi:hypothetical protein